MLTGSDVLSLIVALYTIKLARSPSSSANSYGWQRAEILGALINGVFLVALCMSIALEALGRVIAPPEISNPKVIVVVGSLGLLSNIVGLFLFHGTSNLILLQIMSELIYRTWTLSWSLARWRCHQVAG
jgi:Co/Zn/Cd efflux system component